MSRNKKSRAFKKVQNVQLRPGNADDVPFIFRRMLKDLRRSDFWTGMPNPMFYMYAHRGWEHTVCRSIVKVAYGGPVQTDDGVKTGNPTHILGYIIAEVTSIGLVVHYMNVRRDYDTNGLITADYRRQGIGRKLVESFFKDYGEMKITYTNRTRMFSFEQEFRNMVDDSPDMEYNPCLWFTLNPPGWETGILATLNPQTQKDFHDMEQKYPATA